ncbi:MAG TPA: LacI family DNA-binding transcriptional regulator [Actinomycetota bacterium]|nr:LacI family DNA-binding transcriptional regulator [Actinomycetota bacterium]
MNRFARDHRVTIADVAAHAGVSKTTVSHVLSGNRPVSQDTRARVEDAIGQLGYRPDGIARSLRTRRSHMVALIIPDITNPFYPSLARGLEQELGSTGYRAFICNSDGETERELGFVREVWDRRVDGIVIDSFHLSADDIDEVTGRRVPIVWLGGSPGTPPPFDAVRPDDEQGAYEATRHLIARGHRAIAMIDGPEGSGTSRREGYMRALAEAHLEPVPASPLRSDWTREAGARAVPGLFKGRSRPTAVFCANDRTAIGVLDAAHEIGVDVPGHLAVVGFDDIEEAAMTTPPLTTVANPALETGRAAARLLADRMAGRYRGPARSVTLPAPLVVRATT